MPTTWNRSPEEFHKIYIANTDAFYRVGSFALADELAQVRDPLCAGAVEQGGQHRPASCRYGQPDIL